MGGRAVRRWCEPPYWVVQRLCAIVVEGWESWEGSLALQGVDPRKWTLRTLLNAAEAAIDQAAEDDAERARNRARLYAPPKGTPRIRGQARPGMAMNRSQAQALMAQMAAQDAQLGGRARG